MSGECGSANTMTLFIHKMFLQYYFVCYFSKTDLRFSKAKYIGILLKLL